MKTLLRFSALATLLIIFTSSVGWGQNEGDFRSINDGNWSNANIWEVFIPDAGGWVSASEVGSPISNYSNNIYIRNIITYDLTAEFDAVNITIDASKSLEVNSNGTMNIFGSLASSGTLTNNGTISITSPAGSITSTGTLTNNGTFTMSSGAISGTFSNTGIFNLGGGDINIDITNTGTFNISGGTVNDIINNGTLSISSGDIEDITNNSVVNINGNYTIHSGEILLNNSSGSLGITVSMTLTNSGTITNDGNLTLNGNLINNGTCTINGKLNRKTGTYTGSIIYGSNSTLEYSNGSYTTGNEFTGTNYPKNLIINLSSYTSTVTLGENLTIEGTLTLTTGKISSGNYILTLGNSTSNTGTLSWVGTNSSAIVGNFKRFITNESTDVIFPLGYGTFTSLRTIKFDITSSFSSGGSLTAKYVNSNPGGNTTAPIDPTDTVIDKYWNLGYWEITTGDGLSVGTAGRYSLNLTVPSTIIGVNALGKLRIMKKANTNSGTSWTLEGNHVEGGSYVVKRKNFESFSIFGIGGSSIRDNNQLEGANPVTMESFSHNTVSNNIMLTWVTSMEENNSGFDIERKKVEGEWSKIGYIKGNGTTNNQITYKFSDKNLATGKYQYRLKQIDYNGNFEYHALQGFVEVGVPNKFEMSQNYPNPFNPVTKIDFEIPENRHVNIKVYDMLGKEVKTLVNEIKQAGYHTLELNASNMASGTYIYRMVAGDFTKTLKMVVVK